MHKITTIAIAAALGLAWTAFPAGAADDTLKNKAERTGDKIENKAERVGDKLENKSERAADKMENKAERAKDKAEAKTERAKDKADAKGDTMGDKIDRAVDKTKAKTREMKDKVSNKMDRGDTKNAQQALQAKGYNPGPIDGIHGPRTSAALRDYQKAEGLNVTGQMDGDTRAKLMASGSTTPSPSASTTTPSASPSTTPPAATPPSTVGSPSQAPAPPTQVEKK
jgi:peptidoglycan hydrolase-like protein with peptidoglycan-binding domain